MQIYEIIEFTDGGPNDRGKVVGYTYDSDKELDKFQEIYPISTLEYNRLKQLAAEALQIFEL